MKNKTHVAISFFVILLFAGFFIYKYQNQQKEIVSSVPNSATTTNVDIGIPPLRTPPLGFKEYRHLTYHFSLFYPDNLSVKEYKEEGTAMTVIFQDAEGDRSFQIFIVPYGESQITEQRFKMDVPSGVKQEPVDVMINGIRGTMFWSENAVMGPTRSLVYKGRFSL